MRARLPTEMVWRAKRKVLEKPTQGSKAPRSVLALPDSGLEPSKPHLWWPSSSALHFGALRRRPVSQGRCKESEGHHRKVQSAAEMLNGAIPTLGLSPMQYCQLKEATPSPCKALRQLAKAIKWV